MLRAEDIPWRVYIGMTELLRSAIPLGSLHTGEAGGWHTLMVGRVSPRGVALCLNGRPWQELTFGVMSPELYPPEFVGRVEVLQGTEAVVLTWDALGIALNVVEPTWRTGRLLSRLWYLNAAYGVGGSDGMFVLSPHPAWELTGGYRRLSSEGRFANGGSNGWNVRLRLHWVPLPQLSVTLSELFTQWVLGLNGGIDAAATPTWWDPLAARPVFEELNDRLYRHDVTLTMLWQPDSQRNVVAQLWYVPVLWERHWGESADRGAQDEHWRTWQLGIRLQGELASAAGGRWVAGLMGEMGRSPQLSFASQLERRRAAGYLLGRWGLGEAILQAGVRLGLDEGDAVITGGVGAMGRWGKGWWRADLCRGRRSQAAVETGEGEEILQALGEIGWGDRGWGWKAGVIGQRLLNAVIASGTPPTNPSPPAPSQAPQSGLLLWGQLWYALLGGELELAFDALPLAEAVWRTARVVFSVRTERRFGQSLLRGEVSWELFRVAPLRLSPILWSLHQAEGSKVFQHSGGELRIAARLGMAYVRLALRNLLNVPWYQMPWYPQPGRSLVFELTWGFLE